MVTFPNAKINLGLNIVSKQPDGFHNIETLFYPIPLMDVLEIVPNPKNNGQKIEFKPYGIEIPGDLENNLCIKAYKSLDNDFNLPPVKMVLQKNIPMGAGLGGGSSDGAHALTLVNQFFNLGLTQQKLEQYASGLGSDCAFFIRNTPSLGTEKGNILENIQLNLEGYFIVLVKPNVHVGTAEAYAGVSPKLPETLLKHLISHPINDWKQQIRNDFEASIFPKHPEIRAIKDTLYSSGAIYASMTGSGSAVYGLFEKETTLKSKFSGMFYWESRL